MSAKAPLRWPNISVGFRHFFAKGKWHRWPILILHTCSQDYYDYSLIFLFVLLNYLLHFPLLLSPPLFFFSLSLPNHNIFFLIPHVSTPTPLSALPCRHPFSKYISFSLFLFLTVAYSGTNCNGLIEWFHRRRTLLSSAVRAWARSNAQDECLKCTHFGHVWSRRRNWWGERVEEETGVWVPWFTS